MRFDYMDGSEKYIPLGKTDIEKVKEGVYVFMDEENVLCYMDVKQCDQSKVTKDTKEFIVYVQGNKAVSDQQLSDVLEEICNNLTEFCSVEIWSKGNT